MSMYLRVKRQKDTIFLRVNPTDSFASVKTKLGSIVSRDPATLRLIGSDRERVFEDEATVGDQEVENDAIIYMVYQLGEGATYEIIEVADANGEAGGDEGKK